MTQEEIEHMWKVASKDPNHDTNWHDPIVVKFAKLVAAKEREACAALIESDGIWENIKVLCSAIRARGES